MLQVSPLPFYFPTDSNIERERERENPRAVGKEEAVEAEKPNLFHCPQRLWDW